MSKLISSSKKTSGKPSKKKKEVALSLSRRSALMVMGVMGLGASLSSFGLFGKTLLQHFPSLTARPLYLEGKRMKSKGELLFWVEGWILSEQDLHSHKKK